MHNFTMEEKNNGKKMGPMKDGEEDGRKVDEVGVREEIGLKLMVTRIDCNFFQSNIWVVLLNNFGQLVESHDSSRTLMSHRTMLYVPSV